MKQLSFYLLLSIFTVNIRAQVPIVGTRWTYFQSDLMGLNGKPYYLDVVADTIVHGKHLIRLSGGTKNCALQPTSPYVLFENKQAYQYDIQRDKFFLLYDWNKNVGDTVTAYVSFPSRIDSFKYVIDSIIYWTPNGEFLKVQTIHYLQTGTARYGFASYHIIEKLGANAYFFPQYIGCDPVQWGSIRCFEEPGQTPVKFVPYQCDSIIIRTGTEDFLDDRNVRIYPTLVQQDIHLETLSDVHHEKYVVYVTDALNRIIRKETWQAQETSKILETNNWQSGIYFVTLQNENGARSTKKIIKID